MNVKQLFCPECEYLVKVGARPFKGQRVECAECGTQLTIVSLNPLGIETSAGQKQANAKNKARLVETACPECNSLIKLKTRLREGEGFICTECGTNLEVISTDPLELDVALPVNIKGVRHKKQNSGRKAGKYKG